jgi:hypothetical protein
VRPRRGDLVTFPSPESVRDLVYERQCVPRSIRLLAKQVPGIKFACMTTRSWSIASRVYQLACGAFTIAVCMAGRDRRAGVFQRWRQASLWPWALCKGAPMGKGCGRSCATLGRDSRGPLLDLASCYCSRTAIAPLR